MPQFPHPKKKKNDIISQSLPASQGSCEGLREGTDRSRLLEEQTLFCLAGFLTFPSQTRSVSFCKIPVHLALGFFLKAQTQCGCFHQPGPIHRALFGAVWEEIGGLTPVALPIHQGPGTDTHPVSLVSTSQDGHSLTSGGRCADLARWRMERPLVSMQGGSLG
jgi:hypothetical protein